jgi:hypothetical protein
MTAQIMLAATVAYLAATVPLAMLIGKWINRRDK